MYIEAIGDVKFCPAQCVASYSAVDIHDDAGKHSCLKRHSLRTRHAVVSTYCRRVGIRLGYHWTMGVRSPCNYDAVRKDFHNGLRQIDQLLHNNFTGGIWIRVMADPYVMSLDTRMCEEQYEHRDCGFLSR
jgi:hypothetical protein